MANKLITNLITLLEDVTEEEEINTVCNYTCLTVVTIDCESCPFYNYKELTTTVNVLKEFNA